MIQYPISFHAQAIAGPGTQSPWDIHCADHKLSCAVPIEFSGGGLGLSPEDLYLQALTNCFVATLKVYAEASKISFEKITVISSLVVDKNETLQPWMKEARFKVTIYEASHVERLRTLAQKAIRSGFILNSVKTSLDWSIEFISTKV